MPRGRPGTELPPNANRTGAAGPRSPQGWRFLAIMVVAGVAWVIVGTILYVLLGR